VLGFQLARSAGARVGQADPLRFPQISRPICRHLGPDENSERTARTLDASPCRAGQSSWVGRSKMERINR